MNFKRGANTPKLKLMLTSASHLNHSSDSLKTTKCSKNYLTHIHSIPNIKSCSCNTARQERWTTGDLPPKILIQLQIKSLKSWSSRCLLFLTTQLNWRKGIILRSVWTRTAMIPSRVSSARTRMTLIRRRSSETTMVK